MNKFTVYKYKDAYINFGYCVFKNGVFHEAIGAANFKLARRIVRWHYGQSIKFYK